MDAVSGVLRAVRLSGAVYLNGTFTAPWCVTGRTDAALCAACLPRSERVVSYHLIIEGSGWAQLADDHDSALHLDVGELLVVPQGESHLLGSAMDLAPTATAVEKNAFFDDVTNTVATVFPRDPLRFLARTPRVCHDVAVTSCELSRAWFANIEVKTREELSCATSSRDVATACCLGTPLWDAIGARRDAGLRQLATNRATDANRHVEGLVRSKIQAHVIVAAG